MVSGQIKKPVDATKTLPISTTFQKFEKRLLEVLKARVEPDCIVKQMKQFLFFKRFWVLLAMLWFAVAFAHLEPVRVLASFPTAASSQLQVNLLGADSGSAVTGAIIDLEIKAFGSSDPVQIFKLREVMPGRYEASLSVPPGSYQLGIVDHTFPQEALRYNFKGDLPRPANLSIASWVWAATKARTATPATPSVILVLVVPIVITFLAFIFVFFRLSSKPRATGDQSK